MASKLHLTSILALTLTYCTTNFPLATSVGVNWGSNASHPLPPAKVVELLKSNNINKVKLFDANPQVLEAISGTKIVVSVGIPNSMLRSFNASLKAAENWVHDNLTRFTSSVHIEYISVGDEAFLRSHGEQFHPYLVGAASNILKAVTKANLVESVKVVVPCSWDSFQSESDLPSRIQFRPDVNKTMLELLLFLSRHRSPFFVTISPFLSYHENKNTSLDFALFKETARPRNDSHSTYKNSYDLSHDTVVSALSKAGFPLMDIVIGQIGWPTNGAANATSSNAETFMKGLMKHIQSKSGTPLRPKHLPTEVYIMSLLDEDQRSIAAGDFERHWGIFTFDGQAKYNLDFVEGATKLVNAQNVEYLPSRWCVANNNRDLTNASARALEACSAADCTALSPGSSCFNLSWPANISYAFNSYYQQHDQKPESCGFGGLGLITTVDPSVENCRFFVELQTSSSSSLDRSFLMKWILSPMIVLFFVLDGR
ncbi:hypothetical protein Leryth_002745 [Lithospermum erythrorhizon]|uniref:glucan endo-1,3-beta-D-glucosidase n=1 Tax=Lithospermum erythrorhizon TaxID=34254 RepID=A0AAV3PAR0_LITER|nr:hypothetical protein Leryth_002745 [Lithospermum erythrorhizon]